MILESLALNQSELSIFYNTDILLECLIKIQLHYIFLYAFTQYQWDNDLINLIKKMLLEPRLKKEDFADCNSKHDTHIPFREAPIDSLEKRKKKQVK